MRKIFDELMKTDGVLGGLLVAPDGLVVQSLYIDDDDAEILGALAADVFATVATATTRLGIGKLNDTIVGAMEGSLQMRRAGDLVLVVICEPTVMLGEVRLEMSRAAKIVEEDFNT